MPPFGCTLVDGDADGPGLIGLCGLKLAKPASVPPKTRPDAPTQLLDARPRDTPTGAEPPTEVRKRSANLVPWCERCATGIHIRCANDHTVGHGGDGCIGAYRAKDIAARYLLCLGCWTTHQPNVDESDEDELGRGDQPERHPNRLSGGCGSAEGPPECTRSRNPRFFFDFRVSLFVLILVFKTR